MKWISDSALDQIREQIDPTSAAEQCWILLGTRQDHGIDVAAAQMVPNGHRDPAGHYAIKAGDVQPPYLPHIVGYAHTHLDGHEVGPSYTDVIQMPLHHLGLVIHVPTGTITTFDQSGFLENNLA